MGIIHIKSATVADMTGTVTVGNSAGATTTIAATDLVRPSDWNSAHSALITLSGNTSVNSTAGGTNLHFQGDGNITLAGSTGTLVISGPAWKTYDQTQFGHFGPAAQSSFSLPNNSVFIAAEQLSAYVSATAIRVPVTFSFSTLASSSGQRGYTMDFGIYTRHATNSTVLTLMYSTSYTMAHSVSSNASAAFSYITAIQNSTSYNSQTTSSAGINISTLLHGPRELIMPFSTMLSPGEYWYALRASSSTAGTSQFGAGLSNFGQVLQTFNRVGLATNTTNPSWQKAIPMGVYSTTTGTLPNAISATMIHNNGSFPIVYWATLTA